MDREAVKAKQRRSANSGALGRVLERLAADPRAAVGMAGAGGEAGASGSVAAPGGGLAGLGSATDAAVRPVASRPEGAPGSAAGKARFFPSRGPARVPADVCRPWDLADRPDNEFEHLDDLVRSFQVDGQLQPVVVRPVDDAAHPEVRYEVIAGQARWRAARKAGIELDVVVRPLDDEAAFRAMVGENDFRRGLSDYAKARRLAVSLERGLYKDKSALAQAIGMSPSQLSYFLGFAELDPVVVTRFKRIQEVSARLGYVLHLAVREGFLKDVLRDLPRIEAGEIRRDDIPGVWRKQTGTADPVEAPVPVVAHERTPARKFLDDSGRVLFSVQGGGRRGAVVRIPGDRGAALDEAFWGEFRRLLEARAAGAHAEQG